MTTTTEIGRRRRRAARPTIAFSSPPTRIRTETPSARCSRCTLLLSSSGRTASWCSSATTPLPAEYGFLDACRRGSSSRRFRTIGPTACSSPSIARRRHGLPMLACSRQPIVVNIDHHHDNTRFGTVEPCRRRGVIDRGTPGRPLRRSSELSLTPAIAEALYTGLVTDTGRFQYSNTTPRSLRLAADLVEAGADPQRVFQGVYESMHFAKLKLLARALERASLHAGGTRRDLVSASRRLR